MTEAEKNHVQAPRHLHKRLRRWLTVAALSAIVVGLGMTSAQAAWRVNNAQFQHQVRPNWCWVAVSRAEAIWSRGTDSGVPTQCQIYNSVKKVTNCPDGTGDFYTDVTPALIAGGVRNYGTLRANFMNFNEMRADVDQNHLPMLRWGWDGTSNGHMLLIRGYDTGSTNVSVLDPANQGWSENVNFTWMIKGDGHTWTHSRYNVY